MKLDGYLSQIILAVLLAIAGILGAQVKALYKKYVTTEVKRSVCQTVVRFVEQVYKDIHGEEKLMKAMEKASSILASYGITISEEELVALLEAAVNEFNKSFERNNADSAASGKHIQGNTPKTNTDIQDSGTETSATIGDIIAYLKDPE